MNSVHLQDFPRTDNIMFDGKIVEKMDLIRDICNSAFSLSKDANIRVRMPLPRIIVCGKNIELEEEYVELLKQEINVKNVELYTDDIEKIATKEVVLNMKECGKIFGSKLKDILQAQKKGNWKIENGILKIADCEIDSEIYNVVYTPKNGTKAMQCNNNDVLVMIDTNITDELKIEGLSRDVIRIIQQTRKDIGLEISDRIKVEVYSSDNIFEDMLKKWENFIKEQTLSNDIVFKDSLLNQQNVVEIDGNKFAVKVVKI